MFKLAFATFWSLCALSLTFATPMSRILGGEDSKAGIYPWVVSVRVNNVHVCTGSIISNTHILTAGHCVSENLARAIDPNTVNVRVGSINQFSGGKIVSVQNISINANMGSFLHDVAVLTLTDSLKFTLKINKIDVAESSYKLEDDTAVTVTGWGLTAPKATPYKLQQASYSVLNKQLCELDVGYGYDSVICLKHEKGQGICTGDDGAGVVKDAKLVGVISFAFGACGTEFPDIAAKTSYYGSWINSFLTQ